MKYNHNFFNVDGDPVATSVRSLPEDESWIGCALDLRLSK